LGYMSLFHCTAASFLHSSPPGWYLSEWPERFPRPTSSPPLFSKFEPITNNIPLSSSGPRRTCPPFFWVENLLVIAVLLRLPVSRSLYISGDLCISTGGPTLTWTGANEIVFVCTPSTSFDLFVVSRCPPPPILNCPSLVPRVYDQNLSP